MSRTIAKTTTGEILYIPIALLSKQLTGCLCYAVVDTVAPTCPLPLVLLPFGESGAACDGLNSVRPLPAIRPGSVTGKSGSPNASTL